MDEAMSKIVAWGQAGEPLALIVTGTLVAVCFVVFNAARILLYLPQLKTGLRDQHGCPTKRRRHAVRQPGGRGWVPSH